MIIILLKERPVSWNTFYAGRHWIVRKQEALRVHLLLKAHTLRVTEKFKGRVSIVMTVYFKDHPIDPDNIVSKLYIDGLKDRVIVDDTYEWVDSVTTRVRVDKENPRVEIEVSEL